jgi:putative hydrolase of the HAD superfamily
MDIKVDHNTIIVFDLDDTLYNELDFLKSAYSSIALILNPSDWKQLYSTMFSMYRCKENVFEFLAKTYEIELHKMIEMYRDHLPDIQLHDGALELLSAIKNKSGKIAIITDGRSKTQRAKIESLGILDYIDKIIVSEETGSEKPNPSNFEAIENFLPGAKYYYIADNLKKDFIAPNSLGWKSIALVDNGKNIHFESFRNMDIEHRPHVFILSLRDIRIT